MLGTRTAAASGAGLGGPPRTGTTPAAAATSIIAASIGMGRGCEAT